MIIHDPDPAARASEVRDALAPLAKSLRKKGASVEIIDGEHPDTPHAYVIGMIANMRCSPTDAEMTTRMLEDFAQRNGGRLFSTMRAPFPSDPEHSFGLTYTIEKANSPKRPRAA